MSPTRRRTGLLPGTGAMAVLLAGCQSDHHILDPASPDSAAIQDLWWILFWVSIVVLVVVLALWTYALLRRRPPGDEPEPDGSALRWILVGGALIPAVILIGLTAVTVLTGARISSAAEAAEGLVVEVIGHQFWWEVRYPDAGVITANEIHVPAGQPTRLRLMSNDVIHSLWIPRLHGKLDLTPGRVGDLVLRPEEPGVYRGFCAEFCGAQHALMGLLVVAQPEEEFEAWLAEQARPAAPPADDETARGRAIFSRADCHHCHTIRGGGQEGPSQGTGPDLTHLSSRRTLGSVTVDNTTENLARWIANPHDLKPGVLMPPTLLQPEDLRALVRYLEGVP
jgi:cytochrome c oxidase subunit II